MRVQHLAEGYIQKREGTRMSDQLAYTIVCTLSKNSRLSDCGQLMMEDVMLSLFSFGMNTQLDPEASLQVPDL